MKILIIGYFFKFNLGDDAFVEIYKILLNNHDLTFMCSDKYEEIKNKEFDLIICGGGDIINDYFINDLTKIKLNIPMYAISIGIPYINLIDYGYLDLFDHVILRNETDIKSVQKRLGTNYCNYYPDIVFLFNEFQNKLYSQSIKNNINNLKNKYGIDNDSIGVYLPRTIYNQKKPHYYNSIINSLKNVFKKINKKIFLVPFNHGKSQLENDHIINNDIGGNIIQENLDCVTMLFFMKLFKYNICGRLHSHIYSMINCQNTFSICLTRKVKNFVIENDLEKNMYLMDIDPDLLCPMSINENELYNKIDYFLNNENCNIVSKKMNDKNILLKSFKSTFVNIINKCEKRKTPPFFVSFDKKSILNDISNSIISAIFKYHHIIPDDKNAYYKRLLFDINNVKKVYSIICEDYDIIYNDEISNLLSSLICLKITNITQPEFYYGLNEQILTDNYNYTSSINYLINETYSKTIYQSPYLEYPKINIINKKKLNMKFISQLDFKGYHRSGWQYVIDHFMNFHDDNSNIIFDAYLDRTFHWANDCFEITNKIPFKQKWIGFIHHTFNTSYSPFNNMNLIKNENFIKSLPFCKGIFVMSNYIKKELEKYINVPINVLYHPTDLNCPKFDLHKFIMNDNKKIVQIGGWLRDPYAIYNLQCTLKKAVLKGKNMNNYFKPDNLFENIKKDNRFVSAMIDQLEKDYNEVEIINELSNEEYDKLLEKNIIFIKLIDASACNTIIECIVRNTPLLINKIEPVVEYLGEDYPFYLEDNKEITIDKIIETYKYLLKIDKKKLSIEYFIDSFCNSTIYNHL